MIQYRKTLGVSAKNKTVAADLSLPEGCDVAETFGFAQRNGSLVDGGGLREPEFAKKIADSLPEGEKLAAFYPLLEESDGKFSCVLYCESGKVYAFRHELLYTSTYTFTRPPAVFRLMEDMERLILSDGRTVLLYDSAGLTKDSQIPSFDWGIYYHERMFYIKKMDTRRIFFSAPGNIRDVDSVRGQGGVIQLFHEAGQFLGFREYDDSLYLFYEYGFCKFSAEGDEEDFSFGEMIPCAKIYGDSIAVTANGILWLGEDGLHLYDNAVKRVFPEYTDGLSVQKSGAAAAIGGKYYLQAAMKEANGEERDIVLIADTDRSAFCILKEKVSSLIAFHGKVYGICEHTLCEIGNGARSLSGWMKRVWQSKPVNPFGGRCVLREIRLRGEGAFVVRVFGDTVRSFSVCAEKKEIRIPVNLSGTEFCYRIEAGGAAVKIDSLAAVYSGGEK